VKASGGAVWKKPKPFFQMLECHWDTVVERVAAFVITLVYRTRPSSAGQRLASRVPVR
jgi:hypothetical protein